MADRVLVSLPGAVAQKIDRLAVLLTQQRGQVIQRPAVIEAAADALLDQLEGNHANSRA
jgi:hypothetical protein